MEVKGKRHGAINEPLSTSNIKSTTILLLLVP